MKKVVVLGAGLTGMGAAFGFAEREHEGTWASTVLEKEDRPGGLCRTEAAGGFLFDYTGHLLHFRTELFKNLLMELVPGGLGVRQRSAWIYSHGVYTRYPFQANLFGLPREVILECLYDYVAAAFSPRGKDAVDGSDLYEWIVSAYGEGIARHFMLPYNRKLYKRSLSELTTEIFGRFLPQPEIRQVISGAIADNAEGIGYNAVFHYPNEGGIEQIIHGLAPRAGRIETGEKVRSVDIAGREVVTESGRRHPFDALVSTLPVKELIRCAKAVPVRLQDAAARLRHVSVLNVNLGLRGQVSDKHWVYVPEEHIVFHRLGFLNNFSAAMAPAGCSSMYAEISYPPEARPNEQETVQRTLEGLKTMGILSDEGQVMAVKVLDIPYAYAHYDRERSESLETVLSWLSDAGVYSTGRFGAWRYTSMEDSFLEGYELAGEILDGRKQGATRAPDAGVLS